MRDVVAALLIVAVLCWPAGPSRAGASALVAKGRPPSPPSTPSPSGDLGNAGVGGERAAIATALDLLALALGGGAGVTESIEVVAAETGGAVGDQLRVVSAALRWGMDEQDAWSSLPSAWAPAARAMSMAGLSGVPPADLLRQAAGDLRRADEAQLEIAAARLGVTLVIPLGLAFLPAFVLMTVLPVVLALARQVLARS